MSPDIPEMQSAFRSFSAATFNVLIGSPFPAPFVGRWVENLASRAGALPDPLYENTFDAYDASGKVATPFWERANVTYTTVFALDARIRALAAGGEVLLVLDGVKMAAEVFLNGASLGVTADQFLRMTAPVAALLRPGGAANELRVVFLPSTHAANNGARFMACSGGWDC